jgi:hypothetical protein
MAGASLQLIAEATENNYLTGNPQITFFKSVFRRHTNFAIESRKLNFSTKPNFGENGMCRIPKGPDLLYKLYLYVELPEISVTIKKNEYKAFRWLNWLGHAMIRNSKISIGQTEIDEQDGEWIHIWNELCQKEGKKHAYAEMVGNTPELTQIHSVKGKETSAEITLIDSKNLYIPLQFWFCKTPGQALPIIALENAEVMIEIDFEEFDELIWASHQDETHIRINKRSNIFESPPKLKNAYIYADYVYLDTDERKRFVNNRHEYLIEKVQTRGTSLTSTNNSIHKVDLNFSNPVKELIWRIRPSLFVNKTFCQCRGGKQWYNYTDTFDFSGFSGTPEPKGGPGMPGGRTNTNFLYSLPSVNLLYDPSTFIPRFDDTTFTTSPNAAAWDGLDFTVNISTVDKKKTGYDYIEKYHYDDKEINNTNLYKNKTIQNMLGIENSTVSNNKGIWSNPSDTNMMVTDNGENPTSKASIFLNGVRRFDEREGFYFNVIQPYQHHTNVPCNGLNVYSFALDPEDHQPSGSCNFSNISDAEIIINLSPRAQTVESEVKVYALTYNILRIENKTASIAYSR